MNFRMRQEVLKLTQSWAPRIALEQFQDAGLDRRWITCAIREHRKELMKDFLSGQIPLKPAVAGDVAVFKIAPDGILVLRL